MTNAPLLAGGRVHSASNGISALLLRRGRATEANMTGSVPVESKVTVKRITVLWENSSSFLYLLFAKVKCVKYGGRKQLGSND